MRGEATPLLWAVLDAGHWREHLPIKDVFTWPPLVQGGFWEGVFLCAGRSGPEFLTSYRVHMGGTGHLFPMRVGCQGVSKSQDVMALLVLLSTVPLEDVR